MVAYIEYLVDVEKTLQSVKVFLTKESVADAFTLFYCRASTFFLIAVFWFSMSPPHLFRCFVG
jgi:hypothetical protein